MSDTIDIWTKLAAPLPTSAILQRQGAGGRMLDYIDRPVVWDRLDAVVPGDWEFTLELIPGTHGGDEPFAVKGKLRVLGVDREDIGQGKDPKEAATDAFKRCAVQFGIGRQLYHKANAASRPDPIQATTPATAALANHPKPEAETTIGSGPLALDEPSCPKCGGRMWDNRLSKRNSKAPDYKCRNRGCDGVIWPPKPGAARVNRTGRDETEGPFAEPDESQAYDDQVPF